MILLAVVFSGFFQLSGLVKSSGNDRVYCGIGGYSEWYAISKRHLPEEVRRERSNEYEIAVIDPGQDCTDDHRHFCASANDGPAAGDSEPLLKRRFFSSDHELIIRGFLSH